MLYCRILNLPWRGADAETILGEGISGKITVVKITEIKITVRIEVNIFKYIDLLFWNGVFE